jgi:hypothetical protein
MTSKTCGAGDDAGIPMRNPCCALRRLNPTAGFWSTPLVSYYGIHATRALNPAAAGFWGIIQCIS